MRDVMARTGMSARGWALKANLGAATVSRATNENYEYVTSNSTLAKLAVAAGEPMPSFLEGAANVPAVDVLEQIIETLFRHFAIDAKLDRSEASRSEQVRGVALALHDTLQALSLDPESLPSADTVARTIANRQRLAAA